MDAFPVPFRTVALTFLTLFLVTIGILNLRDRASWTEPGDGVFWVESESGLTAGEVAPNGPAASAGIRHGDVLYSIDDSPIVNLGQYSDAIYRAGAHGVLAYGLMSGSTVRLVSVRLDTKASLKPEDSCRILLAFVYLGIGFIVALRGAHLKGAFHFYFVCLTAFVLFLYSYTTRLGILDGTVYVLSVLAILLLPALFLHFCLRFPVDPRPVRGPALFYYAPGAFLGVIQLLWWTGRLADFGLPRNARSSGILDRLHLVYLCAGLLIGAIVLLRRKLAAEDLTARQQMKWVSYGTLGGVVPFLAIYVLPVLLGARAGFPLLASQLFLVLIPLSFAYAILHYRLLDVEAIVRRSAAYLVASSLLLAAYLVFVLILGRWLESVIPDADYVIVCVAALAIAMMFAPLRTSIQARLDRFFYKEKFDDRSGLLEFARTLTSEISLPRLTRKILERIAKTFPVDNVFLFLRDTANPGVFLLAEALGAQASSCDPWRLEEADLCGDLQANGMDSSRTENLLYEAQQHLNSRGIHYVQDLRHRGKLIGVIGLGMLPKHQHFSTEDLDLLRALAGYASIALENADLYRSIETKALDLERLKIYTENIIESINVAVLALDLKGEVTSCNRAFEELYGIGRKQIIGSRLEDLLGKEMVASIQNAIGVASWDFRSTGNIFKQYLQNRRNEKLIVNLSVIPLLDSRDLNSGCLVVMDDITGKVRLENQMLQVEKLSSIGLLAAGIAHEVNTPITGISSYAQMLLKETAADDVRKPILEKIEKQTFRAAEIVNGLLNFARMNGSEFTDLDLNLLIRDSLSLLEHQFRQNHVDVVYSPDQTIPTIYGNAGKLQQVFVNLFLNARDAMPSGGTLRVETSMNDTMVIVDIQDSGVGISPEHIRKIYDPFFTTKSTGKGTGLGLAVTYGIVQEHGGGISVDSTPAKGTRFRLKLPTRQSLQE
jgi:PAS domain S-box-containing protein